MAAAKPDAKNKEPVKNAPANSEAPAPTPRKGGKRLVIVLAALTLLAGGGAAAWYSLDDPLPAEGKVVPPKPPVFVALEAFTVNLQPEAGLQHYLQVGITLRVADQAALDLVKRYMPEIRNRILFALSDKKASELTLAAGKQRLAEEIMTETLATVAPGETRAKPQPGVPGAPVTVAAAPAPTQSDVPAEPPAGQAAGEASDAPAATQPEPARPEPAARAAAKPAPVLGVLFTSFIIQ